MTGVLDETQPGDPTGTIQDVLAEDQSVGLNHFRAGTRIPERPGDGSLRPRERVQHPVPPNSLTWKYFGDNRSLITLLRTAALENMWPQLGQGTSDHSQAFGDKGNFLERGKRSNEIIGSVVYASAADAQRYGVQVRNFHKSIKGEMPEGRTYHALNPETYYWAHVTFFENIFRATDLFFPTPLTRAEKEQIFEESKEWFSLYGVDDRAQPETYDDFVTYLDDVFQNQLVDSKIAQYAVGFAKKGLPAPPGTPRLVTRFLWPWIASGVRLMNAGAMQPIIRERLGLEWSDRDEKNFQRLCLIMRRSGRLYERLPLKYRYVRAAYEGFNREGVDPRSITLESARASLAEARAARSGVDQDQTPS